MIQFNFTIEFQSKNNAPDGGVCVDRTHDCRGRYARTAPNLPPFDRVEHIATRVCHLSLVGAVSEPCEWGFFYSKTSLHECVSERSNCAKWCPF